MRGGKGDAVSLLINKTGAAKAFEMGKADIEDALEFNVSATIDNLPTLFLKHESEIFDVVTDKDGAAVLGGLLPILNKKLSGGEGDASKDDKNSGLLGGFLNKLSAK